MGVGLEKLGEVWVREVEERVKVSCWETVSEPSKNRGSVWEQSLEDSVVVRSSIESSETAVCNEEAELTSSNTGVAGTFSMGFITGGFEEISVCGAWAKHGEYFSRSLGNNLYTLESLEYKYRP